MSIEAYLPPDLAGRVTQVISCEQGFSGAEVFRIEASGRSYLLKVGGAGLKGIGLQRLAADAGLAPSIVHVDESRAAILMEFVEDRGFRAYVRSDLNAVTALGSLVRRLHALPVPPDLPPLDVHSVFRGLTSKQPDFARRIVEQVEVPASGPLVLSHNDLNPTNLLYDGQRLLIVDWASAAPAHPAFDLATLAVFLRLPEERCSELFAAYGEVPDDFPAHRRLMTAVVACIMLGLAHLQGHPLGPDLAGPTLPEFNARLRSGEIQMGTGEGYWQFAMALLNEIR